MMTNERFLELFSKYGKALVEDAIPALLEVYEQLLATYSAEDANEILTLALVAAGQSTSALPQLDA